MIIGSTLGVSKAEFAAIIPTYECFDYATLAIRSFLKYTPDGVVFLIDDASPSWRPKVNKRFTALGREGQVQVHHYPKNGGLTRSWNLGLKMAKEQKVRYAIATNSDVLFCEGWMDGLVGAIEKGYSLVGPISNAPGITAKGLAEVEQYYPDYRLTDDPAYLNGLSRVLRTRYRGKVVAGPVNGFFQMAETTTWWRHAHRSGQPYDPAPEFRMTLNEDELQKRWRAAKAKMAISPASFIFHYRAVTRGGKHRKGKWFRTTNPGRDV